MATVVGTLSVDVTNGQATLTFDESKRQLDGLAAKAQETGHKVDYSMREARESLILFSETMGVRVPGGIARAVSALAPLGPALVAALPIIAIVAATALFINLSDKLENYKLKMIGARDAGMNFGTAINESMRDLEDKFLQAGTKIDDLTGNHLAKLAKELELIDHQSLKDLAAEFDKLGTDAEKALEGISDDWVNLNLLFHGTQEAKEAIKTFGDEYKHLLSGNTADQEKANTLLNTTKDRWQHIVDMEKQAADNVKLLGVQKGNQIKYDQAISELAKNHLGASQDEAKSAQVVLDYLQAQVDAHKQIVATVAENKGADKQETANKIGQDAVALQSKLTAGSIALANSLVRVAQQQEEVSGTGRAGMEAAIAGINHLRDVEIDAANQILDAKLKQYVADANATADKNKLADLAAQFANDIQDRDIATAEANAEAKRQIDEATLTIGLQAIQEELQAKVRAANEALQAARSEASGEQEILKAQTAQHKSAIDNAEKVGLISKRQALADTITIIKAEGAARQDEITKASLQEQAALNKEIEAQKQAAAERLTQTGGDKTDPKYIAYLEQVNVLTAQKDALTQKADADSRAAMIQTNAALAQQSAELQQMNISWKNLASSGVTFANQLSNSIKPLNKEVADLAMNFTNQLNTAIAQSIVEGKNFDEAMQKAFASAAEGVIEYILQLVELKLIQLELKALGLDTGQDDQAAKNKALQTSYASLAGARAAATTDFPLDLIIPEIVFGAAMVGMAEGGIVPGTGTGDTVPAMLTPGEAVLPRPMVDAFRMASAPDTGNHYHVHINAPSRVQALDSTGVDKILAAHASTIARHAVKEIRRRNK